MASKVKTKASFGLSSPGYLLGSVFDAEIGLIIPDRPSKKLVNSTKKEVKDGKSVRKTAGSATVKML